MLREHKASNILAILINLFLKLIREHRWGSSLIGYLLGASHLTLTNPWPFILKLHNSGFWSSINGIDILIIYRDLNIL